MNQAADSTGAASGRATMSSWLTVVVVSLGGVALIAWACAYGIDRACYHAGPPTRFADIGTPRGDYCARVESLHRWLFLIGVPVLLTALALVVTWRRVRPALILAGLIALIAIMNVFVVDQMQWALTA